MLDVLGSIEVIVLVLIYKVFFFIELIRFYFKILFINLRIWIVDFFVLDIIIREIS